MRKKRLSSRRSLHLFPFVLQSLKLSFPKIHACSYSEVSKCIILMLSLESIVFSQTHQLFIDFPIHHKDFQEARVCFKKLIWGLGGNRSVKASFHLLFSQGKNCFLSPCCNLVKCLDGVIQGVILWQVLSQQKSLETI